MAVKGIDVSVHQGKIDWKKVASDGVDWLLTLNTTALAGILSVLTSIIKGIPEVDKEE